MKTVWKHVIQPNAVQGGPHRLEFQVPVGSRLLHAGVQGTNVCVWYEFAGPPDAYETMVLLCCGTGFGGVPAMAKHFASVVDGAYVWHLYLPL